MKKKLLRSIVLFFVVVLLSVIAVILQTMNINPKLILFILVVSVLFTYSIYTIRTSDFFFHKNAKKDESVVVSGDEYSGRIPPILSYSNIYQDHFLGVSDWAIRDQDSTWGLSWKVQNDLIIGVLNTEASWLMKDSISLNYGSLLTPPDYGPLITPPDYGSFLSMTPVTSELIAALRVDVADRVEVGEMHEEIIQATEENKVITTPDNTEDVYFMPELDAAFA